METRKYDVIIYGATGFTGYFVMLETQKFIKQSNVELTWAVAGRNEEKLKKSLSEIEKELGIDLSTIGVIRVDSSDPETIDTMSKQCKVVINCVGPYYLYGEPVVKSCIENKTNYVDISGEPQFLEGMKLKYDDLARDAGVHVVGACGWDSVPADVGLCYLIRQFGGTLNYAECYTYTNKPSLPILNTGTMKSASLAVANFSETARITRQLYPKKLPKPAFKKPFRGPIRKIDELNQYAIPLPSDEPMVIRSQRYFYESRGIYPVQFQGFAAMASWGQCLKTLLGAIYFVMLSYFSCTRKLLFKYPEAMTAGTFSSVGPKKESLKDIRFTSAIIGKGWPTKMDPTTANEAPAKKAMVKVEGPDPAYGATAAMLVSCAMTIVLEKDLCSEKGGVMSPGMAFFDTNIYQRLQDAGITLKYEEI